MAASSCRTCDPDATVITDDDTGAHICLGCGAELSPPSNDFVHQMAFTSDGALDLSAYCLVRPDLTFRERKINDATAELRFLASRLGLSTSMSQEALQLARDATDGELATRESAFLPALCAACCYIIARRHSLPLYLDEAADAGACDPHDLGDLVKRISCHLQLAPLPEFNNGMALDHFLRTSQLLPDIDRLEEIIGQAKFLLDCTTKWSLSTGRHPRPLLAAVATLAAQANGVASVSVDDFAAEMGAVVSTSQTRYKELVETLAHASRALVPWGADLTGKNVVQSAPLLIRLMELKSESDPSDQFLNNVVIDTDDFLNDCNLPVREEEAEYFKISERRNRIGEGDGHLENVKLSADCLSSAYRNVRERINNLKSSGVIGNGAEKRRRCYDHTYQINSWVNKLDERRWKSRKKMTTDEIRDINLGFDAPPPSFVTGLELREHRRERIRAAKCRIDKVRTSSHSLEVVNFVEEPVCGKREKPERKRKGAIDGVDWEDRIIELLLLHGVNETEIEEGQYKRLLDLHVFG
ncbi:Transcription initiation factor IIB 1 [Carex littledalei]|uniref:Transcription initiation factor IIB 1 n=1 Tax=Carex littledalei TaxID=544730 RepID=A0A833VSZ0_9POAL|nr:Transcription initiation factor IIB 1 [Carex littledalei]